LEFTQHNLEVEHLMSESWHSCM